MRGVPAQLASALEQLLAQLRTATAIGEVPLTSRDDLERAFALLEELHGMGDLTRLADHVAGLAKELDDALLGRVRRLAGEFGVRRLGLIALDPRGSLGQDASVPADDRARRQLQLAPPGDVGEVAEGADHRDAGPLLGIGQRMCHHRHLHAEERSAHGRSEERLVALVIGVRDERHARGDQLWSCGLDVDRLAAIATREADAVVGTGALAILELGLGDGRAEGDVPERGCLGLVGLAAREIAQEGTLRHGAGVVVDGLVGLGPVDGEPESAPQLLEDHLVLDRESLA